MRIVHLLAYYGNYFGGIQHSVNEVAKRQLLLGHEVKIITSDKFGVANRIDNVPVKRLKTILETFRVPFTPSLPFALLKETCEVLHVYLPLPWFDMSAAIKRKLHAQTKLVLAIRNLLPNTTTMAARIAASIHDNITIKMAIEAADVILFTNKEFAFSLPYELPSEKVFIIPNGVDTTTFYPNQDYAYNHNQVLFVGRLIPEKGLEILMRAMRIVRTKSPETKLIAVVSDYYNQRKYLDKILYLNSGFLELRCMLPVEELARLYRNSAVFVLPSIGLESFGNVLMEAMASGCPVICTDMPGPRGLVQSGASFNVGTVVPRYDFEKLAEAIIHELKNNSEERRRKIAEFAKSKASWDVVAEQMISLYEQCGKVSV